MKIKENFLLRKITSTGVGGPAKFYVEVKNEFELMAAINWARENGKKYFLIGDGSNLIPNDEGFNGLIIRNKIQKFEVAYPRIATSGGSKRAKRQSRSRSFSVGVLLGAGSNLFSSIRRLNGLGLAGMEKMAGIPGTVGGAIYGCAGAYGQEIKDHLLRVRVLPVARKDVWKFDFQTSFQTSGKGKWLTKKQCRFGYRDSVFKKHPEWVILGAEFKLTKGDPRILQKTSDEIVKTRSKKYPPSLQCPGSFFKNIVINRIKPVAFRKEMLVQIKPGPVRDSLSNRASKLPAAYFLEQAGAKGMKKGGIAVADHHANLIYNTGRGKSKDVRALAVLLKKRVKKKFGIELEEEICYLD